MPTTTATATVVQPRFRGLIVPTLTPLDDAEDLDVAATEAYLEFLVDAGVDALFILGTSGEGAMLRSSTRRKVVEATLRIVGSRVPVIGGVLEASTARIIDEVRAFAGCGLAGYVCTTPLYFDGFTDEDLASHFQRIADAADAPMLVYNIPQFTGTTLSEGLIRRISGHDNIVGIKDSSGAWPAFQRLLLDRPPGDFALLQGFQPLSAISLIVGCDGLVPGYSNVYPALFTQMMSAWGRRDHEGVLELQRRLDQLLAFRGPAYLHASKFLGKALGLMDDVVTSPMPRIDEMRAEALIRASLEAGLLPRSSGDSTRRVTDLDG